MIEQESPVPYHNRFFAKYYLILPCGTRIEARHYRHYKSMLTWIAEDSSCKALNKYYLTTTLIEIELEQTNNLPKEYFLGICEVYNDPIHCVCIGQREHDRLKQLERLSPEYLKERQGLVEHLDLVLITSLGYGHLPHSDIGKQFVTERRVDCKCYLCLKGPEVLPLDQIKADEVNRIKNLIKINTAAINLYIPFRHRQLHPESKCKRPFARVKPPKSKKISPRLSGTPD